MPALPRATWLHDAWWVPLDRESGTTRSSAPLMCRFTALREDRREGMAAEVVLSDPDTLADYWARVTLPSAASRNTFIKSAGMAGLELPAPGAFDRACLAVVEVERKGQPAEPLIAEEPTPHQWVVPGWIPRDEVSIVYGDGGLLKSYFCLALAVAGLTGQALGVVPHGPATPWQVAPLTAVLYLDWEGNRRTHAARLWGMTKPLNVNVDGRIIYRKLERPLADVAPMIRADVAAHKIDLAVYDSIGLASGAEPETADAALRTFGAMRSIPTTNLAIGHIAHSQRDLPSGMDPRPFGSVHMNNQPRSAIWCSSPKGGEQPNLRTVTYKQTKNNLGPEAAPSALRWAFDEGGYVMALRHDPDPSKLPVSVRIVEALRHGARETEALADEIGVSADALRRELSRLKNRGTVVSITEAHGGRGKKQQWGLIDRNRGTDEP